MASSFEFLDMAEEEQTMTLTMLESLLCDEEGLVAPDELGGDLSGDLSGADLGGGADLSGVVGFEEEGEENDVMAAAVTDSGSSIASMVDVDRSRAEMARKKRLARSKKKAEKDLKRREQKFEVEVKAEGSEDGDVSWQSEKKRKAEVSSSDEAEPSRSHMTEEEQKDEKKQRRLIRNRMSAQLHRERKKAYVDHLEGLVKDRDNTIAALRAENESLKAQLQQQQSSSSSSSSINAVSDSEQKSLPEDDLSSTSDEESTKKPKKRARSHHVVGRAATALLAAVSCVALLNFDSNSTVRVPSTVSYHPEAFAVVPASQRRHLLLADTEDEDNDIQAAEEEEERESPVIVKQKATQAFFEKTEGSSRKAPSGPRPVGYERDVTRELFNYPQTTTNSTTRPGDLPGNVTRSLLRGSKPPCKESSRDVAPYKGHQKKANNAQGTSYVVCSKAAGVFAGDSDGHNKGALLSLPDPDNTFSAGPGFVQLLVPLPDLDASAWGYTPPADHSNDDMWLELGAHLTYGRLVRNVKFTI